MTESADTPFFIEPDGSNREAMRRLGYRFVDILVESAARAASRPAVPEADPLPDSFAPSYEMAERGRDVEELLRLLKEEILDHVLNPAHPGYVGHMDSLASAVGIFSDAIVSACNNNMLSYEMSLAFTRMERLVMDWAARGFGWDGRARGFLVSGGTLANIQALWTARNARFGEFAGRGAKAGDSARPVVIASEHAHYSFLKAANLLGIGRDGVIFVPTGPEGRVEASAVEGTIHEARRQGLDPFCVVGIAGTTVTGAIEPLEEIGAIARREGLWYHVDAAYGGSLFLSRRFRGRIEGAQGADSITWNPQKWLFVPKTCASLLYRDGSILESTIRERFVYGREDTEGERANLGEYTIQGTRRVDVLKLWLTLEHLGRDRLARLIESAVDRAAVFAERIDAAPDLELIARPDLNIVCFRALPAGIDPVDGAGMDAAQAAVQREVARRGHGWLSLPIYRARRILRAVILHPRCDEALLERLLSDVREAAARV